MADEEEDINIDESEDSGKAPQKKGGFLNPFIIKILTGVLGAIGIIVLVIVTSLLTTKCSSSYSGGAGRPDEGVVDIRKKQVDHPETFVLEKPFRQQLKDGKMLQLNIALAFNSKDKKLQIELTQNVPQIRDIIIMALSRLDGDYFRDPEALAKLKEDLLKQINRMLNEGEIEDIYIQEYTLMGN